MPELKPFWVSWWRTKDNGSYTLVSPWWVSGTRGSDDADSVCAAVMAKDDGDARRRIERAHDKVPDIEFRFVSERPADWSPFCERFQRAKWMEWTE